ncbi:MAG: MraY family glycosyltransferase [Proteobacteria bacterium]|nr:MraY family glycosyltransferase [Pseudomonadota bacterium]
MIEFTIIIAFLTSLISLIIFRPIAIKLNLVDYPTERKTHAGNVPLLGGICVFFGIIVPYFLFMEFDKFSSALLITASLILIHGVWDDFANLKAKTKIAFQVFLSAIMIYVTDVKLNSFGDLFGVSYPLELGILSIPITIIAVIALTNAINMIDGLDGLAAGIVLIAITGLICFNLTLEFSPFTSLLLVVASALLPFIIFNIAPYPKIKVFLGDGGSLFLGYTISWALIYSAENINNFTPSFALWCVAIPLFDFFVVIIIRIVKKHSLMIARKDHIHHFLENLEFSKKLILLLIVSSGLAILLIGILIENKFPALSFSVFLILFLFYLFIRIYINSEKKVKRY